MNTDHYQHLILACDIYDADVVEMPDPGWPRRPVPRAATPGGNTDTVRSEPGRVVRRAPSHLGPNQF